MTAPAPSPAEAATIDRFGIFEAEERVEQVARAIFDAGNPIVESFPDYWERVRGGEETRDHYRRLAVAAIAVMPASPAEEAVRRVEALAEEWKADAVDGQVWLPRQLVISRLRAALAAQDGEAGR